MPGRHGKQSVKRGRSKRQRPTQMENTLKDSIRSRCVKERSILSKLIAPRLEKKFANAVAITPLMPMFAAETSQAAKPKAVAPSPAKPAAVPAAQAVLLPKAKKAAAVQKAIAVPKGTGGKKAKK